MILLDTHIWIWYLTKDTKLKERTYKLINLFNQNNEAYISSISIWEICKLHEKGKIKFSLPLRTWLNAALTKGILIQELSTDIYLDSCSLPGNFHGDPADQMIVATARTLNFKLVTYDKNISNYKHVELSSSSTKSSV
ncbi:MAG: twitching motility protein PilT [Candidatus Scalindua sp.]|nr:type II toxin-antitoxin system VapC family toxin [Planctomycetota bacterium]NOG84188.1 type II toxin-antitoxin system VapC family toxin [Planctomycetota bacterium]GJQ57269.1 MAG: twitching motility protein PilT [Candidatus Scalindua sp.]